MAERLFTPRFVTMFCYSFIVFVSVFQLLPAAPYRILDLGGTTAIAGLFQGVLTFSSAASAAFTGPITDRLGHRPVLIVVSLVLAGVTGSYAFITSNTVLLIVAFGHGLIWSALLSASGAYMTATIPESRRAEGLSYWGLSSVTAIGAAPALGFWVYHHGWAVLCAELAVLNLLMALVAWYLPDDRRLPRMRVRTALARAPRHLVTKGPVALIRTHVEWRVLLLSIAMALVSFGWGSLTSFSALYADQLGVTPRSTFLTAMATATVLGRLTIGRALDQLGYRRVLLWCFLAPPAGLLLLTIVHGKVGMIVAGLVFGAGFGLTHPAYTAFVLGHIVPERRGAAFGAMLASFDTGIGLGSALMGWFVHALGFRPAFAIAASLAALSIPYFLVAERRLGFRFSVEGDGMETRS